MPYRPHYICISHEPGPVSVHGAYASTITRTLYLGDQAIEQQALETRLWHLSMTIERVLENEKYRDPEDADITAEHPARVLQHYRDALRIIANEEGDELYSTVAARALGCTCSESHQTQMMNDPTCEFHR